MEESQSQYQSIAAPHPLSNSILPASTATRRPLSPQHTESTPSHHNRARPIMLGIAAEHELHRAMLAREQRLSNPPREGEQDIYPTHPSGIGSAPPSAFDVNISQKFVSTSSLTQQQHQQQHHHHHSQSFAMTDDYSPTPTLSSTLDSIPESPLSANPPSFSPPPVAPVGADVYSPLKSYPQLLYPTSFKTPASTSDGRGATQFGSTFQRAADDSLWERQIDGGSYYAGYSDNHGEHNKRRRS